METPKEVEILKERIAELESSLRLLTLKAQSESEIQSLKQQLESARGVIGFYGDKLNWRDEADSGVKAFGPYKDHKTWTDCGYEYDWENLHDEGDKARKWLEENK